MTKPLPFDQRRRRFLSGAVCSVASLPAIPAFAAGRFAHTDIRRLSLTHARTGERLRLIYYEYGVYLSGAMREIDYVMRDYRVNRIASMDVRLVDLVSAMQHHLGGQEILVTSAFRTPDTNRLLRMRTDQAARNSLHMQGMAIDFYVLGHSVRALGRLARLYHAGGVGIYRQRGFIHTDVGPKRNWSF